MWTRRRSCRWCNACWAEVFSPGSCQKLLRRPAIGLSEVPEGGTPTPYVEILGNFNGCNAIAILLSLKSSIHWSYGQSRLSKGDSLCWWRRLWFLVWFFFLYIQFNKLEETNVPLLFAFICFVINEMRFEGA
jgi:hypothetical protein